MFDCFHSMTNKEFRCGTAGRRETSEEPRLVDVEKPRDTVLDVTVKDDVDDLGHDVIVIDSVCDAGTADRLLLVGVFW